ncbi:hypothetical protein BU23DRAFT_659077 [Bimuria novae-zelandiae CBS 107.79]|uniref:Uncharacterized protein n=1 Tax=Bimuria novae-zelandiae CBS 107.79 TaxID=1447943 RepID=A0A6A5USX9_9PLEO|nr:hypothetical protein BU23DRAFT_659077 [Bimuria novae-zelandiae CBS 107.79]
MSEREASFVDPCYFCLAQGSNLHLESCLTRRGYSLVETGPDRTVFRLLHSTPLHSNTGYRYHAAAFWDSWGSRPSSPSRTLPSWDSSSPFPTPPPFSTTRSQELTHMNDIVTLWGPYTTVEAVLAAPSYTRVEIPVNPRQHEQWRNNIVHPYPYNTSNSPSPTPSPSEDISTWEVRRDFGTAHEWEGEEDILERLGETLKRIWGVFDQRVEDAIGRSPMMVGARVVRDIHRTVDDQMERGARRVGGHSLEWRVRRGEVSPESPTPGLIPPPRSISPPARFGPRARSVSPTHGLIPPPQSTSPHSGFVAVPLSLFTSLAGRRTNLPPLPPRQLSRGRSPHARPFPPPSFKTPSPTLPPLGRQTDGNIMLPMVRISPVNMEALQHTPRSGSPSAGRKSITQAISLFSKPGPVPDSPSPSGLQRRRRNVSRTRNPDASPTAPLDQAQRNVSTYERQAHSPSKRKISFIFVNDMNRGRYFAPFATTLSTLRDSTPSPATLEALWRKAPGRVVFGDSVDAELLAKLWRADREGRELSPYRSPRGGNNTVNEAALADQYVPDTGDVSPGARVDDGGEGPSRGRSKFEACTEPEQG